MYENKQTELNHRERWRSGEKGSVVSNFFEKCLEFMTTHFLNSPGIFSEKYMDETFSILPSLCFQFSSSFFSPLPPSPFSSSSPSKNCNSNRIELNWVYIDLKKTRYGILNKGFYTRENLNVKGYTFRKQDLDCIETKGERKFILCFITLTRALEGRGGCSTFQQGKSFRAEGEGGREGGKGACRTSSTYRAECNFPTFASSVVESTVEIVFHEWKIK